MHFCLQWTGLVCGGGMCWVGGGGPLSGLWCCGPGVEHWVGDVPLPRPQ